MEISSFALRLIVLLIPGIIATLIVESMTVHQKWTEFRFVIIAIVLGGGTYLLYQLGLFLWAFLSWICAHGYSPQELSFWKALLDEKSPISGFEIMVACLVSVLLALAITAMVQKKWLNRIVRKLNISDKYGDENLYTYFLNSRDVSWVWVRDRNRGLTYEGLREAFSEADDMREIVLKDVNVYTHAESKYLYHVPTIYLSLPLNDVTIEKCIEKKGN